MGGEQGKMTAPTTANISGMGNVPVASPNTTTASGMQSVTPTLNQAPQAAQQPSWNQTLGAGMQVAGGGQMPTQSAQSSGSEDNLWKSHPFKAIGLSLLAGAAPEAFAQYQKQNSPLEKAQAKWYGATPTYTSEPTTTATPGAGGKNLTYQDYLKLVNGGK